VKPATVPAIAPLPSRTKAIPMAMSQIGSAMLLMAAIGSTAPQKEI
jgi:hypothetical protein